MPQLDLKYSNNIQLNTIELFKKLEKIINQLDSSTGICKSRAYPSDTYLHDHVLLVISFLKKPHRNKKFMEKMRSQIEKTLISYLNKGSYYAIEIKFSSDYYITSQV